MQFRVLPHGVRLPTEARDAAFLLTDNWDDWFEFSTTYVLFIYDDEGQQIRIGEVKIGQFGMPKEQRRPDIPNSFDQLDERFFSLGQDESYYEGLNQLSDATRDEVLQALNDIAKYPDVYEAALKERVTGLSLLRSVAKSSVEGQFRRISNGGAKLSGYDFSYTRKTGKKGTGTISLQFGVAPESFPPTNVHVIIGRNGVGKTHMLNAMTKALVVPSASPEEVGYFTLAQHTQGDFFANIVSVSFSAFDHFDPLPEHKDRSTKTRYSYIGLKKKNELKESYSPKNLNVLGKEFQQSVKTCSHGARLNRWKRALSILESDPMFRYAEISRLASFVGEDEEFKIKSSSLFKNLSSGHKIVLLTISRLVETVEERTLVLIDEPEAHLHPPLLSAFIRSLSDLLINRNGVAIIATHSPVILQEVPKKCVWKIRRSGEKAIAERPERETFGENVGILTREIFGLEVTDSGFHKLLREQVERCNTYEEVLELFNGEMGEEAKAIAFTLMLKKNGQ